MSLENIKINFFLKEPKMVFRFLMAGVFLSAGVFRIFNQNIAFNELTLLKLPLWLSPFLVIFEIGAGTALLFKKTARWAAGGLIVFLCLAVIYVFYIAGGRIIDNISELFVLNLNPTDVFLHLIFVIILGFIALRIRSN